MTGIVRTSVLMKYEDSFGTESTSNAWFRLPSKLTARFEPRNNMSYQYGIGDRFWQTATAGKFSGSVTLTFIMDYNCINYLGAVFDDYEYTNGEHVFKDINGARGRSFSLRFKKLNRMVGGPKDQTTVCTGCVCTQFNVSQSAGSAVLTCTMTCFYVNESSTFADLDGTDWDYDDSDNAELIPVEWSCLNIDDVSVAGTESVGFTISNNSGSVPGCGSRFDQNYYSGKVDITLSTTVYSKNPDEYYRRMYSGGLLTSSISSVTSDSPKSKALKPIDKVSLKSSQEGTYSCILDAEDVMVDKDGLKEFGESELTASPTLKPRNVTLRIKNGRGSIESVW